MTAPRSVVRLLVAWACLAAASAAPGQDVPAAPADVVATVGDTPIFRSELDAVVRRAAGKGASGDAVDAASATGGGPGRRRALEALAIEQLVDMQLLRAEIEREHVVVGRLEVDGRLEQLKKQAAGRGLEWQRFLDQSGLDEGALRDQIEFEIALDKLIRPKLTPAAISSCFERHRRDIDGTRIRVSHIILRPDAAFGDQGIAATLARAAAIRREIVQGVTTFAEAARRHSAGPSRLRGGDLGWVARDAPLFEAFVKQAFDLAKGDVSKPFVTPFGIHVVQVTEIEPGRVAIDALRPKVESLLAASLLRELLARLRASTPVSFSPGVAHFDPATPADGDRPRRIVVGGAAAAGPATP